MKILVTGGAGYIGGFMVKRLLDDSHEVVIADSLERGHKDAVDPRAKLLVGNLLDPHFVEQVFAEGGFDGVMHFAGFIAVGESMENPSLYFRNNVFATVNILDQMQKTSINNFIFSSTGTVYGNPIQSPMSEEHPKNPENPYSQSKLMVEQILHWYHVVHGLSFTALRYFNAAGGALDGSHGEDHDPETHLIPNAIKAAITNTTFSLYGDDYDTPDGTCIRDYIHVIDLVEAHVLALEKMRKEQGEYFYNVGTGKGFSNKEVIATVKNVSGSDFPIALKPRRPGDAAATVADPSKIKAELGFSPKYSDLETIIRSAWGWHSRRA